MSFGPYPRGPAALAADAGERRAEAFALLNVFYQAGILPGPLVGMVLTGVDFQITCLISAGIFALLSIVQIRAPRRRREEARGRPAGESAVTVESALLRRHDRLVR